MTPDPSTEIFELAIKIKPEDIDRLNHVNNTVYVRWVQDAAVAHWYHAATEEEAKKYVWVVMRHEIDYKYPAKAGDKIIAKTRVGTSTALAFERLTDIYRASDNKLLASARTLWCPVDPNSLRPVRVSEETRKRFSVMKNEE